MTFNNRQLHVSGVPADMCKEGLWLFFESLRFCPSGGPVENVDLNLATHTATVTFADSKGILLYIIFHAVHYRCCF